MNKAQLIDSLASKFDGNRRTASAALEAVLDTITRTVVTGEKVGITGFGVFEKLDKPARTVRNPATGASVKKKKTSVPRFRPGAELKAYVSGEKKFARVPAAKKAAPAKVAAAAPAKVAAAKTTPAKAPATKRVAKTATAAPATTAAPAKRATKTAAAAPPAKTSTSAPATKTAAARKTTATKAAPAKRAPRKA